MEIEGIKIAESKDCAQFLRPLTCQLVALRYKVRACGWLAHNDFE